MEALPFKKKGLIQLTSLLPRSYPGHSILTEDLGTVFGEDGQREFSDVLTHLLEQAVLKNKVIGQYSKKWSEL